MYQKILYEGEGMVARFNLYVNEEQILCEKSEWDDINENNQCIFKEKLQEIIDREEIDAKAIEDICFPNVNVHIFLSHSHLDVELAKKIARLLYNKYGLICFIDEELWEYADDLLRLIDKKYCYSSDEKTYNYSQRNKTTAHVHAILQMALAKMIDTTECFVILNTPNSITINEMLYKSYTYSPWIYSEILLANIIRTSIPNRQTVHEEVCFAHTDIKMRYSVNLRGFYALTLEDLEDASSAGEYGEDLLDSLYEIMGIDAFGN